MIIDLLIVIFLAAMAVRGWSRGLVRELVDVLGLIVGILLAFRAAPLVGAVIRGMSGVSEEAARLIGGVVVLAAAVIAMVIVGRALDRRFGEAVAGPLNRSGGAALAVTWGAFLLTICVTLASVAPMPERVDQWIGSSAAARTLANPDGVPQAVFGKLAGDRIVGSLLALQRVFGERRVVIGPDDSIELPGARQDQLDRDHAAAAEVFDLLNRSRVEEGLEPLAWGGALAEVGAGHAYDMYLEGFFSHESPTTGGLVDRLREARITYRIAGENLALAATPGEVHRGLMESPGHRANILGAEYRRVGIAVVSGPIGLMTVQVFTG